MNSTSAVAVAPARRHRRSKRMRNLDSAIAPALASGFVTPDIAITLLREHAASVKFDQSVDLAIQLGVDPRHADQMVRGVCQLPHGTGRIIRVAVFAKDDNAVHAQEAGADIVGAEDLVERIQGGDISFDRCIATPDMMPLIGRLGKILGPRGLMPNPKTGTVTRDVADAVHKTKSGAVEFRVERAGIIHAGIGRLSFPPDHLLTNILSFVDAVRRARPSGASGVYIKSVTLSCTMGPGLPLAVSALSERSASSS